MVRCALVCITKGESKYLHEYISYNLRLGFHKIFLYDNSDFYQLKNWKSPMIEIIRFPGKSRQIWAYIHFLQHFKKQFDYVAFFDSDEFLVLKKHSTIGDFCREFIHNGALGVNWYIFGNNGRTTYSPEWVISRFTKRDTTMNRHVKTIAKCSDIESMTIHFPILKAGQFLNCRKEVINGAFNANFDDSLVQLNHYITKSDEEYQWKLDRGRAATQKKRQYHELAHNLYLNHVEDLQAIRFFENRKVDGIALVYFLSEPVLPLPFSNSSEYKSIYIYHEPSFTPSVFSSNIKFIPTSKEEYQQHFLTYFKTNYKYVLFACPNDKFFTDGNKGIYEFCESELEGKGIFKFFSKNRDQHRILACCLDLLEINDFQVLKMGYGNELKEISNLWFEEC